MSFAIPVDKLRETKTLVAFYHPTPSYPVHILIAPKKSVRDLSELKESDAQFFLDLVRTVMELVSDFDLEEIGYRLITNGGSYQDVPFLHWHLISESVQD